MKLSAIPINLFFIILVFIFSETILETVRTTMTLHKSLCNVLHCIPILFQLKPSNIYPELFQLTPKSCYHRHVYGWIVINGFIHLV